MSDGERDRAEALEREVEEEDFRLRRKIGGYAFLVAFGFLFLCAPVLFGVRGLDLSFPFIAWAFVNGPLLVTAFLVWRGWRIPLGGGRFLEGRKAWRAILAAAGLSLFLFFGRSIIDWLVALVAPPTWSGN
jgi:hypothetical protein